MVTTGASKSPLLYNSRIIDTYLKLLERRYPGADISALLKTSGMTLSEIRDEGQWFSQGQVNTFYNCLERLTLNPQIAREAGRFAVSANALGIFRQYMLSAFGPTAMFQMIGRLSSKLTRSADFTSRKLSENSVEIVVKPRPGCEEEPFQCENRIGFFEAGVMMFNHNLPGISHPECIFRGDPVCRYEVSWEMPRSANWRKVRNFVSVLMVPMVLGALLWLPLWFNLAVVPLAIAGVALLGLVAEMHEKGEQRDSLSQLTDTADRLIDQVNITHSNAMMSKEIGEALTGHSSLSHTLDNVTQVLRERLDYERGAIFLANREVTELEFCAGFGYLEHEQELFQRIPFRLDQPESTGLLARCFGENRPLLINGLDEMEAVLSPRRLSVVRALKIEALICCPIRSCNEPVGVLMLDNPISKCPIRQVDMSLIEGITPSIGMTLHNVQLLEGKERQFATLLQVMSASIDAHDALTRGHSEKVTEYALQICHMMDLDEGYCEAVRVASLLHDYGKLGVPDAILKKNGSLDCNEYEIVKNHAVMTGEILRQINFEDTLSEVPAIAQSHHEKIDGSGYPEGLKGEEIPLGARIIAVADVFEALTATRHYRGPLPLDDAVGFIRKGTRQHFDPQVVGAFERCLERGWLDA